MSLQCGRDGACCRTIGAVVMTRQEWERLATRQPLRQIQIDEDPLTGMVALRAEPCPFFSLMQNTCTVYEDRPYNCRRFWCGRVDVLRQPFPDDPMTLIVTDGQLRRRYANNQRAHQPWALAHGWTNDEPTRDDAAPVAGREVCGSAPGDHAHEAV